jgi:hypothetical protein
MGIYKAVASVRSGSKMPRCQYQITSIFLVHFNTFWVLATIYRPFYLRIPTLKQQTWKSSNSKANMNIKNRMEKSNLGKTSKIFCHDVLQSNCRWPRRPH